jgi:DNA-binding transcriptional ArsR family regulator
LNQVRHRLYDARVTPAHPAIDVFAAVASPVRRSLLALLRSGETGVTGLAERFDLTQPAVSQQLRVLREAGLVGERRVGRQRLYHLNPGPLRVLADWVREYEHFWNDRLDRLGAYIDRAEAKRTAPPAAEVRRPASRRRRAKRS